LGKGNGADGAATAFDLAKAALQSFIDRFAEGEIDRPSVMAEATRIAREHRVFVADLRGWAKASMNKLEVGKADPPPTGAGAESPPSPGSGMNGVEPAAAPASLDKVLAAIVQLIEWQVVAPRPALLAATLWIAVTYGYRSADIVPRFAITSEMRRCGKSTLLQAIHDLAFNAKKSDNISPSAMFRTIAARPLTLCVDEVDSQWREDNSLRNVLCAGYEATGVVTRNEPGPNRKTWVVTDFPCFCPVALAGIGGLPDTVLDRSIIIRLQRAPNRAGAHRMRLRDRRRHSAKITPHLLAHAPAIAAALATGAASAPAGLDDRGRDNWDSLLAVAELAGGAWPTWATRSAQILSATRNEASGLAEKLMEDIRELVEMPRRLALEQWRAWSAWHAAGRRGKAPPRPLLASLPREIRSEDLVHLLRTLTHRPWTDFNRGCPITERWMADRLRGLGVVPGRGRVAEWPLDADGEKPGPFRLGRWETPPLPRRRTYKLLDLRHAWRRCLPPAAP
jgi:hypothetical protein